MAVPRLASYSEIPNATARVEKSDAYPRLLASPPQCKATISLLSLTTTRSGVTTS